MASSSDDERPNVVRALPSSGGLRPEEVPSLFWDELPENLENNADMLAIQAIIDESTPAERASNFKVWASWWRRPAVRELRHSHPPRLPRPPCPAASP
jgi:hypothetical protein